MAEATKRKKKKEEILNVYNLYWLELKQAFMQCGLHSFIRIRGRFLWLCGLFRFDILFCFGINSSLSSCFFFSFLFIFSQSSLHLHANESHYPSSFCDVIFSDNFATFNIGFYRLFAMAAVFSVHTVLHFFLFSSLLFFFHFGFWY